jgi:hypothetical protein
MRVWRMRGMHCVFFGHRRPANRLSWRSGPPADHAEDAPRFFYAKDPERNAAFNFMGNRIRSRAALRWLRR